MPSFFSCGVEMLTLMLARTLSSSLTLMFWTWAFSTISGRTSRRFFSCQEKMRIVMTLTLTWLLTVCSKSTGIAPGFDLSPRPPGPSSISASQNPLFLTVLRHP